MFKTARNLLKLARAAPPVGMTPHQVVHRENKWRLLHFRSRGDRQTPILMVPSLINRWYVLDLMPGRSMTEWLVEQGHDVFIIDWGTPGDEDRFLSFDDIVARYLGRAVRRACHVANADAVHLMGYCMGGTLAAIHTAAYPDRVASLTTLAAPVSFADDGILTQWTKTPAFDVDALVDGFGNIPWPLLQASFQMLRPTLNLSKMAFVLDRAVLDKAWNDPFLNGFIAKERWANDNVALPGEMFRRYIRDLYQEDKLARGELLLEGQPVALGAIECPVHVISFQDDYIVPYESSAALAELVGSSDVTKSDLRGGHVGAVVSSGAKKVLWPELSNWWLRRDTFDSRRRSTQAESAGMPTH